MCAGIALVTILRKYAATHVVEYNIDLNSNVHRAVSSYLSTVFVLKLHTVIFEGESAQVLLQNVIIV